MRMFLAGESFGNSNSDIFIGAAETSGGNIGGASAIGGGIIGMLGGNCESAGILGGNCGSDDMPGGMRSESEGIIGCFGVDGAVEAGGNGSGIGGCGAGAAGCGDLSIDVGAMIGATTGAATDSPPVGSMFCLDRGAGSRDVFLGAACAALPAAGGGVNGAATMGGGGANAGSGCGRIAGVCANSSGMA